jgi:hypothetical protein
MSMFQRHWLRVCLVHLTVHQVQSHRPFRDALTDAKRRRKKQPKMKIIAHYSTITQHQMIVVCGCVVCALCRAELKRARCEAQFPPAAARPASDSVACASAPPKENSDACHVWWCGVAPRPRSYSPFATRKAAAAPGPGAVAALQQASSTLAVQGTTRSSGPGSTHGRPTQTEPCPGPAHWVHHRQPHGTVTVNPARRQRRNGDGTPGPTTPPRLSAATCLLACRPLLNATAAAFLSLLFGRSPSPPPPPPPTAHSWLHHSRRRDRSRKWRGGAPPKLPTPTSLGSGLPVRPSGACRLVSGRADTRARFAHTPLLCWL